MALSPQLKEILKTSRNLGFGTTGSEKEVHSLLLYLCGRGWVMQNSSGPLFRSRWRLNGKGPWLAIRTAVKRQVDQEHTWGFSREEVHEIALEIRQALENRWSGSAEVLVLTDKLLKMTE